MIEKFHYLHFFRVKRFFEADGNVGNFRNQDREQQHMRGVNLPNPFQDARRRNRETGFKHRTAVNKRCGVA